MRTFFGGFGEGLAWDGGMLYKHAVVNVNEFRLSRIVLLFC